METTNSGKIIAAVPYYVENSGELSKATETGFHKLIPDLTVLGKNGRTGLGRESKDAIPSVSAHLELFHNLLDRKEHELGERPGPLEELWRKVMSLFILNRYRALPLQIVSVKKEDCSEVIWEIFGKAILKEIGLKDQIVVLKYKNIPLAVSDIHSIWTPVAAFHDSEIEGLCGMEDLEAYERQLIYTYLKGLEGIGLRCESFLARFRKALEKLGAEVRKDGNMVQVMNICSAQWGAKPTEVKNTVFSIPTPAMEVPYPFFSSLCLTLYTTTVNQLSFEVIEEDGSHTKLTALLPLSKELVSLLENTDDIRLQDIAVNGNEFARRHELTVTVTLAIGKENLKYQRRYKGAEICYAPSMPLVAVFPYVDIPKEEWRDYNLVLRRGYERELPEEVTSLKGLRKIDARQIDMVCQTTRQVKADEPEFCWFYAKARALPKFIGLCLTDVDHEDERNNGKEAAYIGCIAVGRPGSGLLSQHEFINNKEYDWAIDLGTSNTIVASREQNGSIDHSLTYEGLYKPLLENPDTAEGLRFAIEVYAPYDEKSKKFRTMAVVYQKYKAGTKNRCYEQGCAMFPEFDFLVDLFGDPIGMEKQQIVTDIKFAEGSELHSAALYLYIGNMLWLGCLKAVLNGARKLNIWISYPRKEVYDAINEVWEELAGIMKSKCSLILELEYVTEADANYYFQQNTVQNDQMRAGITNDFGIIDIGHGTSDMNFYFHAEGSEELPKQLQISVRYAGEEILVNTIQEFFQDNRTGFSNIWDLMLEPEAGMEENSARADLERKGGDLIKKYEEQAETVSRIYTEQGSLYEQGALQAIKRGQGNILITLLENIGLSKALSAKFGSHRNQELLLILKFKYMNLFLIYAHILKKCTDLPKGHSFNLYLYGGGRHGIQPIIKTSLSQFGRKDSFGETVRNVLADALHLESEVVEIVSKDDTDKNEVVDGLLYKRKSSEQRKLYAEKEAIEAFLSCRDSEVNADVWNDEVYQTLENAYRSFIEFYRDNKEFQLPKRTEQTIYWYIAIDMPSDDAEGRKRLVTKNRQYFNKTVQIIWRRTALDQENTSEVLYQLFSARMSAAMLLNHLR